MSRRGGRRAGLGALVAAALAAAALGLATSAGGDWTGPLAWSGDTDVFGPRQEPDSELQRTGRIALLRPGEDVPLTVAWHAADGTPVRLEYGKGSLDVAG
jgi:hypothetical protein